MPVWGGSWGFFEQFRGCWGVSRISPSREALGGLPPAPSPWINPHLSQPPQNKNGAAPIQTPPSATHTEQPRALRGGATPTLPPQTSPPGWAQAPPSAKDRGRRSGGGGLSLSPRKQEGGGGGHAVHVNEPPQPQPPPPGAAASGTDVSPHGPTDVTVRGGGAPPPPRLRQTPPKDSQPPKPARPPCQPPQRQSAPPREAAPPYPNHPRSLPAPPRHARGAHPAPPGGFGSRGGIWGYTEVLPQPPKPASPSPGVTKGPRWVLGCSGGVSAPSPWGGSTRGGLKIAPGGASPALWGQ